MPEQKAVQTDFHMRVLAEEGALEDKEFYDSHSKVFWANRAKGLYQALRLEQKKTADLRAAVRTLIALGGQVIVDFGDKRVDPAWAEAWNKLEQMVKEG